MGLVLTALTPSQTLPGYSKEAVIKELSQNSTSTSTVELSVPLPENGNSGWLGIVWIMVAMIPTSIGGGLLSPSINSLLTKNAAGEIGSTLGLSAALVSAANAINPLVGGGVFKLLGSTAPFLIGGVLMGVLFLVARTKIGVANTQTTPVPQ